MLLSALVLSLGIAVSPDSITHAAVPPQPAGVAVYLGCQVDHAALTDCKVVNDEPIDASVAGQALKLAQQMSLPAGLAEHQGRIVIKLNVKP